MNSCFLVLEYDTTLFKGCKLPQAPTATKSVNGTETPTPRYHDLKMTGCIDYFHKEVTITLLEENPLASCRDLEPYSQGNLSKFLDFYVT